jgi:DNA-binding LacI/PurR family transcriptional regulator
MKTSLERGPDALPLHIQLAGILRDRILQGIWQEGALIPSEKVLCAEFNVARGTLRQALRRLEDDGFLRREQGRGTYVQRADTKTPYVEVRTRRVAFIVPYVRDSSVPTVLVGFQEAAERHGWTVLFRQANNGLQEQQEIIERLISERVAGIALYPADSDNAESLNEIIPPDFPIVLVDRYLKGLQVDFVASDHFGGALWAVQYLIDNGHRRIGFVRWLSSSTSIDHRLLGYQQALRERDIPVDPGLTFHVESYPTVDVSSLAAYLRRPNRPTAVMAANDQIAIALYRAAMMAGLRVPQDLSIVGFDDLDISSRLEPPLTTLAQPFKQIGETAVQLLHRRINAGGAAQHITLSSQLMIRGSVAPPRSDRT